MAGRRRGSHDAELWLLLLALILAGGSLVAGSSLYRGIQVTLGFVGGLSRAYYAAYNGTQYYSPLAVAQLGKIATLIQQGQRTLARDAIRAWLDVSDPLGIIREAMVKGEIIEDDSLFRPR